MSGVAAAAHTIVEGARAAGHEVTTRSSADGATFRRDEFRLSAVGLKLTSSFVDSHDLVHIHGPAPSIADVALLRTATRRPVIYTHHFTVTGSLPALAPLYGAYDFGIRRLAQRATRVVTTTDAYARHVAGESGLRVDVIPWGTEAVDAATPRAGEGPLRVLVLGQMRRYKGHEIAIEAVRGTSDISLTVAGDGPLRPVIEQAAATCSNVAVVVSPDHRQVQELFRTHDVIALPALNESEAFGIVLLEGMAHGCVPVASDLRGVAEVAEATGLVFRAGDPTSMAKTLRRLARDSAQRRERSAASIARSRELSWNRTVASYLELFDEVGGGG